MTILKAIYKLIFGVDYGSLWRQFAQENHGIYSSTNEDKVEFRYKEFTITFEIYTHFAVVGGSSYEHVYTKGIVEFISLDSFKLLITPHWFIDSIGELFGKKDIQIGDMPFDNKFTVKSNNEGKTLLLLSNNSILKILQDLKTIRLELSDDEGLFGERPKDGNFMLYYVLDGKIECIEQLNKLYRLFTESLDSLSKLNSIEPRKASSQY
jgi:hypothetical protein